MRRRCCAGAHAGREDLMSLSAGTGGCRSTCDSTSNEPPGLLRGTGTDCCPYLLHQSLRHFLRECPCARPVSASSLLRRRERVRLHDLSVHDNREQPIAIGISCRSIFPCTAWRMREFNVPLSRQRRRRTQLGGTEVGGIEERTPCEPPRRGAAPPGMLFRARFVGGCFQSIFNTAAAAIGGGRRGRVSGQGEHRESRRDEDLIQRKPGTDDHAFHESHHVEARPPPRERKERVAPRRDGQPDRLVRSLPAESSRTTMGVKLVGRRPHLGSPKNAFACRQ